MWTFMLPLVAGVVAQATPTPASPLAPPQGVVVVNRSEAAPSREERLTQFDPSRAGVRWSNNRWQLEAGNIVLKDFGRHEADAREAARLVRALALNQHGQIGTPRPVMEYWLSSGRAPSGPVPGFRPLPFNPTALKVEQVEGQWCVRDGSSVLFNFGGQEGEARHAQAVIQRHGFNRVGHVGRGTPAMLVLLAGQDSPGPSALQRPDTPAPERVPSAKQAAAKEKSAAESKEKPGETAIAPTSLPYGRQLTVPGATPATDRGPGADRVPFEWRQLQVRRDGKSWKLVSGTYTLADFGPNERDARTAQSMVQFYRCSEHCLIGQPAPLFSYFLSGSQAPRGMMLGVEKVPFRTEDLTVRRGDNGWVLGDTTHTLFQFGDNEAAARHALKDIKFYRFDMLCRVGRVDPHVLNVLVRSR